MSRDEEYQRTGKGGPGKCSVPESREEGTIRRVGPCLSIKNKGNKEGLFGLALKKSMTLWKCSMWNSQGSG